MKRGMVIIVKKVLIGMISTILLATSSVAIMDFGMQTLDFSYVSEDQFKISIGYADCSGYSVQYVNSNDLLYRGEMPQNFDDYLPSNRIKITLGDCKMSERIEQQYAAWEVYDIKLKEQDICFMWCPNDDHGIDLFIASDSTLCVDEQSFTKLTMPIGKISLNIKVDNVEEP